MLACTEGKRKIDGVYTYIELNNLEDSSLTFRIEGVNVENDWPVGINMMLIDASALCG